jgi:hypothetical protein
MMKLFLLTSTMLTLTAAVQAQTTTPGQMPNLLDGYNTRPPWTVAGVDYGVGVPSGTVLQDPTIAALPAGCNYANNTVTCNGSSINLSGYNFAQHGTQLVLNGGGTVSNNSFAMTSCQDPLVNINGSQSVAFTWNTLNGNGGQCSSLPYGTLVNAKMAAGTTLTSQYNAFNNVPQDALDVQGPSTSSAKLVDSNSLINQEGFVGHPDSIQLNGGRFSSVSITGNTYYTSKNTVAGTQPLHVEAQLGSNIGSTTVNNNVILTPGSCNGGNGYPNGCVANFDIACKNDPGWTDSNTNFSANGNYIDASGAIGATSNNYGCSNASFGNNVTLSGSGQPTTTTQESTPTGGITTTPQESTPSQGPGTGQTVVTAGGQRSQPPTGVQTITPGQGTLTDAAGNVWTITASGSIMEGDTYTPGGGGTSALTIINGKVLGLDSSGKGWFVLSDNGQSWTSTQAPTGAATTQQQTAPAPQTTTAGQTVTIPPPSCGNVTGGQFGILPLKQGGTGQIIDSAGNVFVPRGVNVMYGNGNPSAATLKGTFPGINFVRLAIYNYNSPQELAPYVDDLTSNGIVVELEDHNNNAGGAGGGQGVIFTGQTLTDESSWYASVASAFKNNPYVWFGTNNEPSTKNASGQTDPAGLSQWQRATYDAIRGTGNQSIVFLETTCWTEGGKPVCNQGYDSSAYSGMSNVAWDNHVYGWLTNFNTDQATNDQFVSDNVTALASIKSAGNAIMPVVIAEYGNSTTGQAIDPNGTQVVNAVNKSVSSGGAAGASAWAWGSGNPGDGLTNGGSSLSSYGQQVASAMTQGAPSVSVCKTPATATASTTTSAATTAATAQTAQPQTIVAQTGSGSQSTDSQPTAQTNAQNDTVAAATASSVQATSDAVNAALQQAQAIQTQIGSMNLNTKPGLQAVGAGGGQ